MKLYKLLTDGNRFELDKDRWLNDVMTIVFAVESELNIHMKYFEQYRFENVQISNHSHQENQLTPKLSLLLVY